MTRLRDRELLRLAADERLDPDIRALIASSLYESPFQAQVLNLAEESGWLPYHTRFSKGSHEGFPDIVLARPPVLLLAELKRIAGRYSPKQRQWLAALRQCSQIEVHEWNPSDWAEIEEVLR